MTKSLDPLHPGLDPNYPENYALLWVMETLRVDADAAEEFIDEAVRTSRAPKIGLLERFADEYVDAENRRRHVLKHLIRGNEDLAAMVDHLSDASPAGPKP